MAPDDLWVRQSLLEGTVEVVSVLELGFLIDQNAGVSSCDGSHLAALLVSAPRFLHHCGWGPCEPDIVGVAAVLRLQANWLLTIGHPI